MCFQGFVYFACGHNHIYSNICAQRSEHPYVMPHACPNYTSSSVDFTIASGMTAQLCGIGRYYCAYDQDGAYLNHVHEANSDAQKVLNGIDRSLAKLNIVALKLKQAADTQRVSREAYERHPEYRKIDDAKRDWMQKRNIAMNIAVQTMSVIQDASRWYHERKLHFLFGNGSTFQAFVPPTGLPRMITNVLGNEPVEDPARALQLSQEGPDIAPGSGCSGSNQKIVSTSQQSSHDPRMAAWRYHQLQAQHAQDYGSPQVTKQKLDQANRPTSRDMNSPAAASRPKGRRPASKARRESGSQIDPGSVRRSARVQNKRISYNEDTGSSRDPSPEKSDMSGFSPTKSDTMSSERSESPNKSGSDRRDRRYVQSKTVVVAKVPQASLTEMINEWKKNKQTPVATTPVKRRTAIGLKEVLNSTPEKVLSQKQSDRSARLRPAAPIASPIGTPSTYDASPPSLAETGTAELPAVFATRSLQEATYSNRIQSAHSLSAPMTHYPSAYHHSATTGMLPHIPHPQYAMPAQTHAPPIHNPSAALYATPRSQYATPMHPQPLQAVPINNAFYPNNVLAAYPNAGPVAGLSDYGSLRRSFDSATYLTPTTVQTRLVGEPNKRLLPSSSPLQPPSKRQLLMPAHPAASTDFHQSIEGALQIGQSTSNSSPPFTKAYHRPSQSNTGNPITISTTTVPLSAEQAVAPTDLMRAPLPHGESNPRLDERAADQEAQQRDADEMIDGNAIEAEDGAETHQSEIDWITPNEDLS